MRSRAAPPPAGPATAAAVTCGLRVPGREWRPEAPAPPTQSTLSTDLARRWVRARVPQRISPSVRRLHLPCHSPAPPIWSPACHAHADSSPFPVADSHVRRSGGPLSVGIDRRTGRCSRRCYARESCWAAPQRTASQCAPTVLSIERPSRPRARVRGQRSPNGKGAHVRGPARAMRPGSVTAYSPQRHFKSPVLLLHGRPGRSTFWFYRETSSAGGPVHPVFTRNIDRPPLPAG
jgi:hypothetical protein